MSKKSIRNLLIFLLIFMFINFFLDYLYKYFVTFHSVCARQEKALERFGKPIHFIFLGDSHTNSDINPKYIPYSFNFASPGENYIQNYFKLKYLLEKTGLPIKYAALPIDLHSFSSLKSERIWEKHDFFWVKYVDYYDVGLNAKKLLLFLKKYILGKFLSYCGNFDYVYLSLSNKEKVRLEINGFLPMPGNFDQKSLKKKKEICPKKSTTAFALEGNIKPNRSFLF